MSATSAYRDGRVHGDGCASTQARIALSTITEALEELGAVIQDVVRYRIYIRAECDATKVARQLGDVFRNIRPAASLVTVAAFPHPEVLLEIEVDAELNPDRNERIFNETLPNT